MFVISAGSQDYEDSFILIHLLCSLHRVPIFTGIGRSQGASTFHLAVLHQGVAVKVVDMGLDRITFVVLFPDFALLQLEV